MITDFSSHLHTYLIIHHMYPSSLMQVPKHSLIYFCGATCASKHKFTRRTKDGVATLGKKALINHAPIPSFPLKPIRENPRYNSCKPRRPECRADNDSLPPAASSHTPSPPP